MSDVAINYKGSSIATMDASGTKTLLTEGKYCEDDIEVVYTKPSGGTEAISIVDTTDSAGGTIRTVTALDISDTTATAADVLNSKYFYTAAGVKTQGTAQAGDDVLVVTLSWDDDYFGQDDGAWVPDATFAEIQAAYSAGKEIVTVNDTFASVCGYDDDYFWYGLYWYDVLADDGSIVGKWYLYSSNGLESDGEATYYETSLATATATDVAYGESFYNAYGYQEGTAPLVVTIEWDDTNQLWVPDRTYAEIYAAYDNGATIVTDAASQSGCLVDGDYDHLMEGFKYTVLYYGNKITYILRSTGLPSVVTSATLHDTSSATISSNGQLLNGVKAVGADGTVYTGTIASKTSSDLSANGATVTAPAGYYASAATKTIASGTEGTPSATKGTVSNHAVTVTPSVTNSAGYITGSTKTGTAVTVSASELVSGSETKTSNGTYDVTNLASLVVAVPIVTYYTGSTAPSSSLGSNGDIYLQTS